MAVRPCCCVKGSQTALHWMHLRHVLVSLCMSVQCLFHEVSVHGVSDAVICVMNFTSAAWTGYSFRSAICLYSKTLLNWSVQLQQEALLFRLALDL